MLVLLFQDRVDYLVGLALPGNKAVLEARVQLVHLDLMGGLVLLDLLAVQVEEVFPDLSALLVLADFQVKYADSLQYTSIDSNNYVRCSRRLLSFAHLG